MRRANRVASALRARGINRGDLVAVSLDRSIEQIVSIVGVLLAGAAYVPIDPHGPIERRRFVLADSRPRVIITTAALAPSLPSAVRDTIATIEMLEIDEVGPNITDAAQPLGTPQDVAYVIYTSGSTGTPKGVLNQHDGIANHLAWMAESFPLSVNDRVLGKTPTVFDVSVWELFWPLSQGACVVLASPGGERDPAYLVQAIESHGITNVHFVPTVLRVVLERDDLHRCRSLTRVICSGETLTAELRDRFFDRMPGPPALINLYGPTEAAVHVTGWVCAPRETGPVPIGRPLPNVRTYIVDENLGAVSEGVRGELLLGGPQVARGYLGRPELTGERFIPDPFAGDQARCYRTGDCVSWRADGAIDFWGRYDAQVQIGGARVELGEIEAVLRRHPAVGDAAVLLRETESSRRLVAYLRRAHADGVRSDPSVESMREMMEGTLPDYMMPSRFLWLDEFPVTPTGKLDRQALPDVDAVRPRIEQAFAPPHAGTEARLERLWRNELRIDPIGRDDDFYVLGGDSLGAVRLSAAIEAEFGIDVPPGELLRSPTIALLASRLDTNHARTSATSTIVTLRAGNGEPPLYLPPSFGGELFYWGDFVRNLRPGRPVYGLTLPNVDDGVDLGTLAAKLVCDLIAFQPEGPYHLAGYSFSAALALEMAQQLLSSGRKMGVLAMIDYGPGEPDTWPARARSLVHFVTNLPYWLQDDILQDGWVSVARRVQRKLASWRRRLVPVSLKTVHPAEDAFDQMFDREEVTDDYRRLAIERLDAFYRYAPAVYGGQILLFRARCRPLSHSLAPMLGWDHYAVGEFERVAVACNHDNILTPPHVGVIAARLDEALASAAPLILPG